MSDKSESFDHIFVKHYGRKPEKNKLSDRTYQGFISGMIHQQKKIEQWEKTVEVQAIALDDKRKKIEELEKEQVSHINFLTEEFSSLIKDLKQKLQAAEERERILREALTVATGFVDGMAIITKSKDVEMILKQCHQALEKVRKG